VVFVAVAAGTVPTWGATGATTALLSGTAATVVASVVAFPRLVTRSLVAAALSGSAAVIVVGLLT
jgi:hypothetical protein